MVTGSSTSPPILPETNDFSRWLKLVKIWCAGTNIPPEKRASVITMNLKDVAIAIDKT